MQQPDKSLALGQIPPEVANPLNVAACLNSSDCVKVLDCSGHIQFFSEDGLRLMEIDDIAAVDGVYWPALWPAEGRQKAEDALKAARQRGVATFTAERPTAKGTPKLWDVTVATLPGSLQQFTVISRDITASRDAELQERATHDRILAILRSTPDVLWDVNLKTDKVWWSEGMLSTFGYRPEEIGDSIAWGHERIHPDDRARVTESIAVAIGDGSATWEGEFRCRTASGAYIDVFDRATILRDANGEALRFAGVMQDVTSRNAMVEVHRLVAEELAHRVNNILAVVTGLFHLTLRDSEDIQAVSAAFDGRLVAMAHANTAILRNVGDGAELGNLARLQLAPFIGSSRLTVEGPAVTLPAQVAQPIGLALNELATNALKYGALSVPSGAVSLTWEVSGTAEAPELTIRWAEAGGPAVTPPSRKGLGSRLIESGIPGTTVERIFNPTGLFCSIRLFL